MSARATWVVRAFAGRSEIAFEPGRPRPEQAVGDGVAVLLDGVLYDQTALARRHGLGRTESAAALALDAFLKAGEASFEDLRGRFALVIWTAKQEELIVLRDHVGTVPLFYAQGSGHFAAAPVLDTLLREKGVEAELNPVVATGQLLLGQMSHPSEMPLRGVWRLPPGHFLRVRHGVLDVVRYWKPTAVAHSGSVSEVFGELLEQSVTRCIAGTTGPVGVRLSGGIDSATIASATAKLSRLSARSVPLAVSLRVLSPEADEQQRQAAVAEALGLESVSASADELVPRGSAVARSLDRARGLPWPPAVTAAAHYELLARARSTGCTTLLTGDGGDEWLQPFASLARDRAKRLDFATVHALVRSWSYTYPGASYVGSMRDVVWYSTIRPAARAWAQTLLQGVAPDWLRQRRRARFGAWIPPWLLGDRELRAHLADWWHEQEHWIGGAGAQLKEKQQNAIAGYTSALMEVNYSLERETGVRCLAPIWDPDLINFLLGVPQGRLVERGRAKALARDYLSQALPFAEDWASKTFGDPEIARILTREVGADGRRLPGTPLLQNLGIVSPANSVPRSRTPSIGRSEDGDLLMRFEVVALETWLQMRILASSKSPWGGGAMGSRG